MKEREVQSESDRKKIEQRLFEFDVIYQALKEKYEALETTNSTLLERNNYLEDKSNNQRKEQSAIFEENCFLKTKMQSLNKGKRKGGFDGLDLSGSEDLQNIAQEDYSRLQDENQRLADEIDLLRKHISSMQEDNRLLNTQVG
jgi:cell division septum initiation protein DivIVA